ncbi:MAG: sensor histidine kinase [Roseateles sp.]|uniref:sensor histidine kinase n=1 Tax=Roseateles sp. TaxID=1971397 RepID=UPI0040367814
MKFAVPHFQDLLRSAAVGLLPLLAWLGLAIWASHLAAPAVWWGGGILLGCVTLWYAVEVQGLRRRYRMCFESNPLPMWFYDPQTLKIVEANEAAAEQYGYDQKRFAGLSLEALRDSQHVPAVRNLIEELSATRRSDVTRCEHLTATGRALVVDVYGKAFDRGGPPRRIVCAVDRTAEHEALQELQGARRALEAAFAERGAQLASREQEYRVLADLSPQVLWQADHAGGATYLNRAWHELVGPRDGGWLGHDWMLALHPEDVEPYQQALAVAKATNTVLRVRRRFRSRHGEYRAFLGVGAPVQGTDGRVEGWIGVDTDITELEQHARRLEHANEELETLSYTVSHDLRGPVQVIKGFVDALLAGQIGTMDAPVREYLHRVRRNAVRMDELITDLLALSRLSTETLRIRTFDTVALVREVVVTIQDRYPGRVVECHVEDTVQLCADRRLFEALLENLLDNAVKFSAEQPVCKVEVRAWHAHGQAVLQVMDRGVGFPPDLAARLFRPFQRLHANGRFAGTGIGLATVRRIVQLHGGEIEGRNREGGGCLFEIRLPQDRVHAEYTTESLGLL